MKKILIVVGVLVVLVVVAVVFVLQNIDRIVAGAVRKYGSEATQTEVTLDSASVSLTTGEGALKGLTVGNPQPYTAKTAFDLGEVRVHVDPATVRSDTIVIKEVVVDGPKITYEMGTTLRSNLDVIKENVGKFAERFGGGGESAPSRSSKRIRLERFVVRGGTVTLAAPVAGQQRTEKIPDFEMKDLGLGGDDTVEQLTAKIFDVLIEKAIETAIRTGLEEKGKAALDDLLGKAGDRLGGLLDRTRDGATEPAPAPTEPKRPRKRDR